MIIKKKRKEIAPQIRKLQNKQYELENENVIQKRNRKH